MKHISIIPAVILCVCGFEPVHAQAVRAPAAAAFKAGRAAQTVLGSGVSGLPYYCALKNLPAAAKWKSIPVLPAPVSAAQANAIRRVVFKVKQERAARSRLFLSAGLSLYREEILKGYHLPLNYIEGYYLRRIQPYLAKPDYTPDEDKNVLFRGMLLTPEELTVILHKGFSPATSTWNTGTDGRAAVSFSSSRVEAAHYIFQQGFKKNSIGVVFKVRRLPTMIPGLSRLYNSTGTIFYSYENIAPENIEDVLIWGEYGLERKEDILQKAMRGEIRPHTSWTGQFDGLFR